MRVGEAVPVTGARDEQLLGRELREKSRSIGGDVDLLFDSAGRRAVGGGPVGLDREDHSFLELNWVLEGVEATHQRLLPDRQADAVAVLEAEGLLLVREAELLCSRKVPHDVGRARAGTDLGDRGVLEVAGVLVDITLPGQLPPPA